MAHSLRFRQIHLDFHTSPYIGGIGKKFAKNRWQQMLKKGEVNSITCFATCHHGWSYYKTDVGAMHPELDFDLLDAEFKACKEMDINVPIYLTAGVNNWAAHEHPEWREVLADGSYGGWTKSTVDPGFHSMCFNTPYLDLLCRQIEEVTRRFPECDGIFLDIINQRPCTCQWCLDGMDQEGLDPTKEEDRIAYSEQVLLKYYKATTAAATCYDKEMPIFHNSGHIHPGRRDILPYFSHLELESLPTGGWGYDHFPLSAAYARGLDKDFLGMTGKFHTTWGEFGGFKHPNALRYECAAMLAFGSKCSVGDQLHPEGELDESTYEIIGEAYREVKEKEAWCDHVESVADIGLLSVSSTKEISGREAPADYGAGRILLEGHFLFDVIDTVSDFSKYKALILPDQVAINTALEKKLKEYQKQGGKLIMSWKSGLNSDQTASIFNLPALFQGMHESTPGYIQTDESVCPSFVKTPMVMYQPAVKTELTKETDQMSSLGDVLPSYFNRHYRYFCSHQHTPFNPDAKRFCAGFMTGDVLYFSHPVFELYRAVGSVALKSYVVNAIKKFMGEELTITTGMPSQARVSLMKQTEKKRAVLHLLFADKHFRGGEVSLSGGTVNNRLKGLEVIEELLPLGKTEVSLFLNRDVSSVTLQPQGQPLEFHKKQEGKRYRISFTVERFICHQMVEMAH